MQSSPFRQRLEQEFKVRREKNARYSLRAFAALLGTDHSTLSQILRSGRRVPVRQIRGWAKKIGLALEETAIYIAAEHVPDGPTTRRQEQLRHWTAEAMALIAEPEHWQMLCLLRTPGFRPDCRWMAAELGSSVDQVNLAMTRLLRLRLLDITRDGEWRDLTGLPRLTREEFQKLGLTRVREKAAGDGIRLHGRTIPQ
jgi:transcriptional regulator with XRE-family HTH domain